MVHPNSLKNLRPNPQNLRPHPENLRPMPKGYWKLHPENYKPHPENLRPRRKGSKNKHPRRDIGKHHARVNYTVLPRPPRDRKDVKKLFPKSRKYIGTVTACPKCGWRGELSLKFLYDSFGDNRNSPSARKHPFTSKDFPRNLELCYFEVLHFGAYLKNVKPRRREWLGKCYLGVASLDLVKQLNAVLIHNRRVPLDFIRDVKVDRFGLGYDINGVKRCDL